MLHKANTCVRTAREGGVRRAPGIAKLPAASAPANGFQLQVLKVF